MGQWVETLFSVQFKLVTVVVSVVVKEEFWISGGSGGGTDCANGASWNFQGNAGGNSTSSSG